MKLTNINTYNSKSFGAIKTPRRGTAKAHDVLIERIIDSDSFVSKDTLKQLEAKDIDITFEPKENYAIIAKVAKTVDRFPKNDEYVPVCDKEGEIVQEFPLWCLYSKNRLKEFTQEFSDRARSFANTLMP